MPLPCRCMVHKLFLRHGQGCCTVASGCSKQDSIGVPVCCWIKGLVEVYRTESWAGWRQHCRQQLEPKSA